MIQTDYKMLLEQMNYSVAEHEIIYDGNNKPIDYEYKYVNKEFCISLGVTVEEILGRRVFEKFSGTEKFWLEEYYEVVRTGESKEFVRYSEHFDRYFSVFCFKTRENHFVTSFKDVTEFVRGSMDEPSDSELLRTFRTSSKAAFFEFDIKNSLFTYSENLEDIIGRKNITMKNYLQDFYKLTHPDDFKKVAKLNHLMSKGEVDEVTIEIRFFNVMKQDYIWISFFAYVSEKKKFMTSKIKGIVRDITSEKQIELDMKESNSIFKETKKLANIATFLFYPDVQTFEPSEELNEFLGVKELSHISDFRKIVYPEDLQFFDAATNHIINNSSGGSMYRIIKDGQIRYIQSSLFSIKNNKGITAKVSGILRDITTDEINRLFVENSRRSFSQIFSTSPAGIFIMDENFTITMRNKKFLEYTNSDDESSQEFLGEKYSDAIEHLKNLDDIEEIDLTYYLNDEIKYYKVSILEMDKELDNKYQGTVIDVTESVEQTEKIKFLATRDLLTKIYNRNYFEQQNKNFRKDNVGVIICDIDGLKLINDAFGHLEGDKLLIQFAAHLNKTFENDLVARLGGDEFVIVTFDKTIDDLEEYERLIKQYVTDLFMFGISIDVSVGSSITDYKTEFDAAFVQAENIMYRRKLTERSSRKSNALNTIMQTLHEKTHETKQHCDRVGEYAAELLMKTGRKRVHEIEEIKLISSVHDIGKIAVSETILRKLDRLTEDEYETIKTHSESGYKIVSNIINNDDIAIAVLYHHERWDGKGYPHKLEGEKIPLYARVLCVADAYDTMISGRVYQKQITVEEAKKELLLNSGTQFDPTLVKLFIEYLDSKN